MQRGRRLFALALLLFAIAIISYGAWKERTALRLMVASKETVATITSVNEAGHEPLAKSRYGSGPGSVSAYALSYRFDTPQGVVHGVTRMTFHEVHALFPRFTLIYTSAPVGETVQVRYAAADPSISEIIHPPSWQTILYTLVCGLFALLGSVALYRPPAPAAR